MGGLSFRDRLEVLLASVVLIGFGALAHLSRAKDQAHSPHSTADCTICHVTVADIDGAAAAFADASSKCRTCHLRLDNLNGPELTFHADETRSCLDCHSYHSPDEIAVGDRTFHAQSKRHAQRALCSSCHGVGQDVGMLTEGHRAAAGLFHSDYKILAGLTPSEACLICHSEQTRSEELAALSPQPVPIFGQHGSHPTGISIKPGRRLANGRIRDVLDSAIQLYGGRIECQTCHSLSSATQYHLIAGADANGLCLKCHEID